MRARSRIEVCGIVQGVGFRPFVYRLATGLGLAGWVTNTSDGVLIEVEGERETLASFALRLSGERPALSRIDSISNQALPVVGYEGFSIRHSLAGPDPKVLVAPDTAVCPDCIRELLDPADRRFRYPFINCTNCGPRYTILRAVPYDRPNTSMASFTMCPLCQAEYEDPGDRRFHAQPNACPECGPAIDFRGADGAPTAGDALFMAAEVLRRGGTLAVKGLGGFHLAVDAAQDEAVRRLRGRKGREEKPFALMVRELREAEMICSLDAEGEALLTSTEKPIVLLGRRRQHNLAIAAEVAPSSRYYGIMLPYTPLHVLLMQEFPVLVMTSANLSEEPLCADNEEAYRRLSGIADAYLVHDREIVLRCDDSIVRPAPHGTSAGLTVLRRARGFVPAPVQLPLDGPPVLALGPELKGTVCLTRGSQAFIGQHLGDLKNLQTESFLKEVAGHLMDILQVAPVALACDLHPDYMTSRLALEDDAPWPHGLPLYRVQHHHAHVLSAQAEAGLHGPMVGLALDGTGYGPDGSVWGGEILHVDGVRMRRLFCLQPVWMPGGDRAAEQPFRMALSYLAAAFGEADADRMAERLFPKIPGMLRENVLGLAARRSSGIFTSSAGRLFDAVSAILGICTHNRYEAQAAIELEVLTDENAADILPFRLGQGEDGVRVVDLVPAVAQIADMRMNGAEPALLAGMFHRTLSRALAQAVEEALETVGDAPRALPCGGGVFQNEVLCRMLASDLEKRDVRPIYHRSVPTNDGGISLGQAVYALLAIHAGSQGF